MSEPGKPMPAVLVLGTLETDRDSHALALTSVVERFGPVEETLGPFEWEYSRYYEPEMGPGIRRSFYAFSKLVSPTELVENKLFTNRLEKQLTTADGGRLVNLDPGLLTLENLVLATAKPRHQRVYIAKGVYGDLTMTYHTGSYQLLPWTYPDWGNEEVRAFLVTQRERLKSLLKGRRQ